MDLPTLTDEPFEDELERVDSSSTVQTVQLPWSALRSGGTACTTDLPRTTPDNARPEAAWTWDDLKSTSDSAYGSLTGESSSNARFVAKKKSKRPSGVGPFLICPFPGCFEIFNHRQALAQHERGHRSKELLPYPCEQCNATFAVSEDLMRHQSIQHEANTVIRERENVSTWNEGATLFQEESSSVETFEHVPGAVHPDRPKAQVSCVR